MRVGPLVFGMAAPQLQALRALVRERERAAGKKVSRIERQKDIRVRGSNFDPRRDRSKVGRYNTTQLNNYLNELNTFQSRSTRFERGAQGAPLPAEKVREYKRQEARFNQQMQRRRRAYEGETPPGESMTIGQRIKAFSRVDQPGMKDRSAVAPLESIRRQPKDITSASSLDTLTKDIRRRQTQRDYKRRAGNQRRGMAAMARDAQMPDIAAEIEQLTDDQAVALQTGTPAMGMLAERYPQSEGDGGPEYEDEEGARGELRDLVSWARGIDTGR